MALTTYTAGEVLTAASLNANFTFAAANPPASASGLVCVKAETALSSTSVTADNVFTSTYSNYLILLRYTTVGSNAILGRMRVGGVSASGANYNFQQLAAIGASPSSALTTGSTSFRVALQSDGDYKSSATLELFSPAVAEPTNFQGVNNMSQSGYTTLRYYSWVTNHTVATAYDGIEFFCGGNMAGTYAIYGYSKTV